MNIPTSKRDTPWNHQTCLKAGSEDDQGQFQLGAAIMQGTAAAATTTTAMTPSP